MVVAFLHNQGEILLNTEKKFHQTYLQIRKIVYETSAIHRLLAETVLFWLLNIVICTEIKLVIKFCNINI